METNGMKVVKELPDNMEGHIVVFEEPLQVHISNEERKEVIHDGKKMTQIRDIPTGEVIPCNFIRAEGGFGCHACCSGRMIIGKFFKSIQDVIDNKPVQSGNTKCYPDGFIPELKKEQADTDKQS